MTRTHRSLTLLALGCAAFTLLAAAGPADGATSSIHAPANTMLHVGSHGPKVSELQWLLAGHKPNVFTSLKPTFHASPNGLFGANTAAAVKAYKWQLGYPTRLVKPIAGRYFFELLSGQAHRPIVWVAIAAKRATQISPGPTPLALKIRTIEIHQLGVEETPLGSNSGALVYTYQKATGAFAAAWCVSFQQWAFQAAGAGTFAYDTASVYAAVDYGQAHGMLRAIPKVGAIVAFIDYDRQGHRVPGTGHMGYVVKVTAHGFVYIAGNDGNAVREHWIDNAARPHAFIYIPNVAA